MAKHSLKVTKRILVGRKVKKLRTQGLTPANIFGNKITSKNVSVETKPFQKIFTIVGESSLLYLEVEGEKEPLPVFVRQITKNPVTGELYHIAFNQVNLKEKVTAPVPLIVFGKSPAEAEKQGILVQQLDEVEIEGLPTDMPENIQVDVSVLDVVGSKIIVSDLKLDKTKLVTKTDPETIIVQIEALAKEEVAPVVAPTTPEDETGASPKEGEKTPATDAEKTTSPEEK